MKSFRFWIVLGLIMSLLLLSSPVAAISRGSDEAYSPTRLLVKFKAGATHQEKSLIHRTHGAMIIGEIEQLGVQILQVPANKVLEKAQAYGREAAVEFAEPDYIAKTLEVPSDSFFGDQWGMPRITAPGAWDISKGTGVKIAILDTGVDQDHPELASKLIKNDQNNKDFTGSGSPDDFFGHGTHVAGIAAAVTNNGAGVAGVGYEAIIMNGKVLADDGSGAYSWIANGIIWAADNGAKVINMSLGGMFGSTTLKNAVSYAWNKGVVIVAAAGNDGRSLASYPAYYTNCIAVAATDQSDAKASFSNYGSWVDVAAPGVSILSTIPNHANYISTNYLENKLDYGSLNGTSMATPFVSGLAALVWATSYGTSNTNVRSRIETTADEAGTIWTSYGIERINALAAVQGEAPPPPPPPPPDPTQLIISDVTATGIDKNTEKIVWNTNLAATSSVSYWSANGIINIEPNENYVLIHEITLTGLKANTVYSYQVSSIAQDNVSIAYSEIKTFKTSKR